MPTFVPSALSNPAAPSPLAQAIASGVGTGITTYKAAKAPVVIPDPSLLEGEGEEESSSLPWILGGIVLIGGLGTAVYLMTRKSDAE